MNFDVEDDYQHTFKVVEIPIGGKLVSVTVTLPESKLMLLSDLEAREYFKKQIATLLATYMLHNKLVETTRYEDRINGTTKVNVRCYLAPNAQIEMLRMQYAKHVQ